VPLEQQEQRQQQVIRLAATEVKAAQARLAYFAEVLVEAADLAVN